MRTRFWIVSVVVGALAVLAGVGRWTTPGAAPGTAEAHAAQGELRADLEGLGLVISDTSPQGKIGRDEAVAVALREQGQEFAGGDVDAYLVRLTDPATAITDRDVWIVRFSGLDVEVPVPDTPSRIPVDGGTVTTAYAYVDAITGEWLLTWAEG